MKKIYLAAMAVATLALSSCSQDEVLNENPMAKPQAIEFGVYTGKAAQSRGLETVSGTTIANEALGIQSTGFGITAFYTDETNWTGTSEAVNFMWNQQVTYSGGWTYDPVKYWPTETTDKISFFAYAPYSTEKTDGTGAIYGINPSDNIEKGTPTVVFTVQDKASDMVDFVADQIIDRQHNSSSEEGNASTVEFTLQHELSRLTFDAKVGTNLINTKGTTIINIKTVELDGIENGKFYKSATYKFGNTSDARGTWDYTGATFLPADYSLETVLNFTTPAAATYGGYVIEGVQLGFAETTTAKSLFGNKQYLFLIPVTANDGTGLAEKTAAVTFTYDIVTVDSSLTGGHSVTPASKTVWLPAGIMKQGVATKITFLFEIDQIEVSATVDSWGTEGSVNTNIPYIPDVETK